MKFWQTKNTDRRKLHQSLRWSSVKTLDLIHFHKTSWASNQLYRLFTCSQASILLHAFNASTEIQLLQQHYCWRSLYIATSKEYLTQTNVFIWHSLSCVVQNFCSKIISFPRSCARKQEDCFVNTVYKLGFIILIFTRLNIDQTFTTSHMVIEVLNVTSKLIFFSNFVNFDKFT